MAGKAVAGHGVGALGPGSTAVADPQAWPSYSLALGLLSTKKQVALLVTAGLCVSDRVNKLSLLITDAMPRSKSLP